MTRRILEGVRVLDLTQIVAGPYCTRMLADLGADVIKVDPPAGPGVTGPRPTTGPAGQNVGKRSIVLDLKHPDGLRLARELAARADVLVQNYRPGALDKLGLGAGELRKANPRLVYTTICGFGQGTSFAARGAYGATAHAEAGWLWVQQQAQGGDEPFAPGVTVADIATGMNACTAILAALYDREHTGEGQAIDIALMDSQIAFLAEVAAPALATPASEPWAPFRHGLQRAKDGYVAINVGSPRNWARIARVIGADPSARGNQAEAERLLAAWVAEHTTAEVAERFEAAGSPYGVVKTMHEALEHPYFTERGMLAETMGPGGAPLKTVSSPLFFSNAESAPASGVPWAGGHTSAILAELGYDEAAVQQFLATGAAG